MTQTNIPGSAMEPFNAGRFAYRLLFDFGVMLSCFSSSANKRVLDFGAGTGWISEFLARLGYEVYAIDVDRGMPGAIHSRAQADSRLDPTSITAVIGSGMDLPFADGLFSHLCCFDTLHHMNDYPKTFQEMCRVLAPGGRAVFIEPGARHSRSKETVAFIETYKKDDPTWIERDVLLEEIEQISKESGFSRMIVIPTLLPGLKSYTAAEWGKFRRGNSSSPANDYLNLLKSFNYNEHLSFYCEKDAVSEPKIEKQLTLESAQDALSHLFGKKIVIDLTPMLPGGDNGGAKLMTVELVRALAGLLPETTFVLLTSESSHAELDELENKYINIQRMCVLRTSLSINPSIVTHTSSLSSVQDFIDRLKARARQVLPPALKQRIKRWRWFAKHAVRPAVFLRRMQVDLLFCPFGAPFYADPFIPTISVIYDLQYRAYPQFFTPEEQAQREEHFKNACQKADYLVTISEFVRKTVIEEAGDFPPERIIAIPIGLLRPPEQTDDEMAVNQLLEKHNLRRGEYILYPANFWQHKNHAMLLTAFNMYRHTQTNSSLKLVCTGAPGSGAEAFRESARRMGLADWVSYAGYVSPDDYDGLLREAFAMIFPSLYEGFGIPVLEAMAAGVPVLCSDITSLPEVGGEAVLYFDPRKPDQIADSIARLVKEPGLRENQIARGLQRWAQFEGVGRMARQYAGVFDKALDPLSRKDKNAISGVYADGWTGQNIQVRFASVAAGLSRTLQVHLTSPAWFTAPVKVNVFLNDAVLIKPVNVKPGESTELDLQLPEAGGVVEIDLNPTFSPERLGMSTDSRELGLSCPHCQIVDSMGNVVLRLDKLINE